jgi:hypothetical protein
MKHEFSSNLLHNPFYNKFNVPVTQRRDSMQAHANVVWLHQHHTDALPLQSTIREEESDVSANPKSVMRIFVDVASVAVLLLVTVFMLTKLL